MSHYAYNKMSESIPSDTRVDDCLVLKFQEIEENSSNVDTTVYVLYDKNKHHYVVRGQRRCSEKHQSCTYSFNCDYAEDLADFLQYIICKENTVNETLLNYDNLPGSSNDITYGFLEEYCHADYELAGYDGQKFGRKRLLRNLRMLRNIYNYYA
jgi:hypothetical protein